MSYLYGNAFAMPQATLPSQYMYPIQQQQQQQLFYQQTSDAFYEDVARQLAAAAASSSTTTTSSIRRRLSRSSQTHTPAMRVVKPCSSASNSPTSSVSSSSAAASMSQLRKRMLPASGAGMAGRPQRPVSWHPSSSSSYHIVPATTTSYLQPSYVNYNQQFVSPLSVDDMPMSATTYSSQTSPSTAFSPYLTATYDNMSAAQHQQHQHQHHQYYSPNPWASLSPMALPVASSGDGAHMSGGMLFDRLPSPDCPPLMMMMPEAVQQQQQEDEEAVYRQQQEQCRQQMAALHNQAMAASSSASTSSSTASSEYAYAIRAPRTPPMCSPSTEPATLPVAVAVAADDDDNNNEGDNDAEILVGLGLYDPPEKGGCFQDGMDPTLQSYRSSMAQLLGAAAATSSSHLTPPGKGLKLEDAWEPPENMDDDEEEEEQEEEDDERDAEGEEQ